MSLHSKHSLPSSYLDLLESWQDLELETSVRTKLLGVIGGRTSYQMRVHKSGTFSKQALYIYSRPLLLRRWAPYLAPDRLSNLLSMPGLDLPENFGQAVRHIILVPELVRASQDLLSHIYLPQAKLIAFYLCPPSCLPKQSLNFQSFIDDQRTRTRIGSGVRGLRLLKLWGWALKRASDCWASSSLSMHKFLLPLKLLAEEELLALEDIHELYAHDARQCYGNLFQ